MTYDVIFFLGITATKLTKIPRFKERMIRLNPGTAFAFEIQINQHDHAVMACYEPSVANEISIGAMMLLGQIYGSDFFAELRTNQQLGYIVQLKALNFVPGVFLLCFGVESANFDSTNLTQKIQEYVEKIRKNFKIFGLNKNVLNDFKNSLQKILLEKPINRFELQAKVWEEIAAGEFRFNRNEELAAKIDEISAEFLVNFFDALVDPKKRRLLVLKTRSKFETSAVFDGFEIIRDYQALKLRFGVSFYDL